jgi:HAMP domain-containing protein
MSALGLVLLALLLVWRISQRIVRPIDALHSAAAKVSAGQTQARVMLEVGPRELQAVAVEFNRMLDSRERFLTHLAGSEERFRTLASLSADWYWEQDAQYRFVRLEGGIEQNMGMSEQAFLGKTGWELSTLNMTPEDWRTPGRAPGADAV